VHRRDAGLAVSNLLPLDRYVAAHAAERRFAVILLELFATLAVTLAAVGVYGVMSYAVAERRREIAIRLALGAAPARVQRSVLRDGLSVAVAGGALGLVLAASTSGLLRSQLFGVGQFDPAIYSVVPIILLMVATLATWLPARRAARVDALAALRGE
jgi:ABC-type antimicrobial peptide transport system permease subunit